MNSERLERLRENMAKEDIEALLISDASNRRYISGFTGTSGWPLITEKEALLMTDFRYLEQAKEQAPLFEVIDHQGEFEKTLRECLQRANVKHLGFEQETVVYGMYLKLREALKGIDLVPTRQLVEQLRFIKDEQEIATIREAVRIADEAFAHIVSVIKPGLRECEVALELEYTMQKLGASGPSFQTIVASGVRSSLPHGVASEKVIQSGELITLDFGAVYQGYCSDITRTVAVGEVQEPLKEIYDIVLVAQRKGLKEIRAGMTGQQADEVVRAYIREKGYEKNFGHGTGHAIGLDIHELPSLSKKGDTLLSPGMVVTVEPGIYLEGMGGVRIEDDVLLTEEGLEVLTSSPKEWIVIE